MTSRVHGIRELVNYIPVPGTWGWSGTSDDTQQWWHEASAHTAFMAAAGFHNRGENRPFWDTRLEGISIFDRLFQRRAAWYRSWTFGARIFARELADVPLADRNIIAHSFGLAPVLIACAEGLEVRRLVSVGSPVREDLADEAVTAHGRIGAWLHIGSTWSDRVQVLGELFDGAIGIYRRQPFATRNDIVPGIGHSRVLQDPTAFRYWLDRGWLDFLHG